MKKGKLFIQIQTPGETQKSIKLFGKSYPYEELVEKVKQAYMDMTNGTLHFFEFVDMKGCVHFLGDYAFRNAHIWVQTADD